MAKRIAVFCDGTWSTLKEEARKDRPETNVAHLYRVVKDAPWGADGLSQISEHFSGVGVERDKLLGGATGRGLDQKILEAYAWVCANYDVGDQVFLFGFSRGAYTARSLAGLIRTVGYLREPAPELLQSGMEIYRSRAQKDKKADNDRAVRFRNMHAKAWVESGPQGPCLVTPDDKACDPPHAIRYLGIWDTVGALGVPSGTPFASNINRKHRFHDTDLSRMVAYARHALATDEVRTIFSATPWANLDKLNQGFAEPRYLQAWFPGDHGSVGGGGAERRLSDAALLWIAEGASQAGFGLDMRHPVLEEARARIDVVNGPLANVAGGGLFDWLISRRPRAPMLNGDIPYDGTLERMVRDQKYRPQPLKRVWPASARAR